MVELRGFIDVLRDRYGIPYPLAHERPFAAGRELLRLAQDTAGLAPEFCLVAEVRGQYVLTSPADAFVRRVEWDADEAVAWRPHDDPRSPVRMRPDLRFGRPSVGGVSTEVIWEHSTVGELPDEIADEFELPLEQVRWALAYETSARAA